MSAYSTARRIFCAAAFLFLLTASAFAQYPCPAWKNGDEAGSQRWSYSIQLADAQRHLLRVTMKLAPTAADMEVQLPVWNATYQVRDFAQHIDWLRATDAAGTPVPVREIDKTTWAVPNAASVEYEIAAVDPGPFGAEFTQEHAFLNLAQVLVYPVGHTHGRVEVSFGDVPGGWKIATALRDSEKSYCADSYDHLVDSPVEIGTFREFSFDEGGGHYRVVVHSGLTNFDGIENSLRKIVAAETGWMNDRPFEQYTFIYHLPAGIGRGGMEHAYSTAIESSAGRLAENPVVLESTTAHEFFHLWNVKRIRPQSMEPIDYTKENYTRALWFSEGVDSTVADIMLVRAGLIDESAFLERLARQITELESRPAKQTQSAEDSSLDAWLEKYPYYRSAARSVSYYNKGQIIGVLLDLEIRRQTHGQKSLRDLFQWMNQHYAKQGKFFDDSNGVREAAEAITGASFEKFFQAYVSGTGEIPYTDFFHTVGLDLRQKQVRKADAGFDVSYNFERTPAVISVDGGGEAERAGLHVGDLIQSVNGQQPEADLTSQIERLKPGDTLKLRVTTRERTHDIKIKLASREETQYEFAELPGATSEQIARRKAWERGDSQTSLGQ